MLNEKLLLGNITPAIHPLNADKQKRPYLAEGALWQQFGRF